MSPFLNTTPEKAQQLEAGRLARISILEMALSALFIGAENGHGLVDAPPQAMPVREVPDNVVNLDDKRRNVAHASLDGAAIEAQTEAQRLEQIRQSVAREAA